MKILFLNPPFTEYGGLKGHGGLAPPLNLGYLASYLRAKEPKHKLSILDCEALGLTYAKIEEHLKKESPDILAITAPTPAFAQVIEIAKIAKKVRRDTKIIVGGPHACALPEETAGIEGIDFVITGEGEITFYELVRTIEGGGPYSEIEGVVYQKEGKVIRTGFRKLIENLDVLPFPARDLMPHRLYHPPPTKRVSKKHSTSMITSRGCPYD
ncbi:cobalamin-dependent protein, partial [bacterium]|nr:cobalamin-dependent protein [bacterium]